MATPVIQSVIYVVPDEDWYTMLLVVLKRPYYIKSSSTIRGKVGPQQGHQVPHEGAHAVCRQDIASS